MIRWFLSLFDPERAELRDHAVEIEKENTLLRKQLHDAHSALRRKTTEADEWRLLYEGKAVGQ
jgi:hypothetical protein